MTDDQLISEHIVPDPYYSGPGDVRLHPSGVHVWAIIGQLAAEEWDSEAVAHAYGIPIEEIEAAKAYYRQYPDPIDGRLAANGDWPVALQGLFAGR